ncbi:MAG: hypothetical protein AAGA66_11110 [Bacteroidota bacterium]
MKREFLKLRHKVMLLCVVLTLSLMVGCDQEEDLPAVEEVTPTEASGQHMPQEYLDMENKVVVVNEKGEITSYFDEAGIEKNLKGEPINVGANGRTQNNGTYELGVFYSQTNLRGQTFSIRTSMRTSNSNRLRLSVGSFPFRPLSYAVPGRVVIQTFGNSGIVEPNIGPNSNENTKFGNFQTCCGFWPSGGRVEVFFQTTTIRGNEPGNLCGYAYRDENYRGPVIPVYKYSRNRLHFGVGSSINNRISSFRWFNGNSCRGILFSDEQPPRHTRDGKRTFVKNGRNIPSFNHPNFTRLDNKITWISEDAAGPLGLPNGNQINRNGMRSAIRSMAEADGCKTRTNLAVSSAVAGCEALGAVVTGGLVIGGKVLCGRLARQEGGNPGISTADITSATALLNAYTSAFQGTGVSLRDRALVGGCLIAAAGGATFTGVFTANFCSGMKTIWQEAWNAECK